MPEMSENMEIINSLAKNTALFNMIPMSDDDREKMAFIKESDNIPVLLELDSDYIFNGNLKKDSIIGNKDDFLDNLDEEITSIAYDSRNNSRAFAETAAGVLCAAGIKVYFFETLMPTLFSGEPLNTQ